MIPSDTSAQKPGRRCVMELEVQLRQKLRKLTEVSSITVQLSRALDHKDQISVRLLLAERGDPIHQLQEIQQRIDRCLLSYPEEEAIHMKALLEGADADSPDEEPLCQLVDQNRRLLEKILAMDRAISLRMGGKRSFYRKYREDA